jgi:hypothetical protein
MKGAKARCARAGLLLAATVVMIAIGQTASYGTTTPVGLHGERLISTKGTGGATTGCKGASGSFSFRVSGTATGPYPGSFTASGTVTLAKYAPVKYAGTIKLTSRRASITINESLVKYKGNDGLCLPGYGYAGLKATYRASVRIDGHLHDYSGTALMAVTGGARANSGLRQNLN